MKSATVDTRAKRGDIVTWGEQRTAFYLDRPSETSVTWYIGIVTAVTRDGLAKKADTGLGISDVDHTLGSAVLPAARVDMDAARAWLASNECYPRSGSTRLRSISDAREVVRRWLRD